MTSDAEISHLYLNKHSTMNIAIGPKSIILSSNDGLVTEKLPLGYDDIVEKCFVDFPPNYSQVDDAINLTEEVLEKYQDKWGNEKTLFCKDIIAKEVIDLAYNTLETEEQIKAPAKEIEHVFNRFADIVKGLPASMDVIPDRLSFSAYLLILREVLHHMHFDELVIIL